MCMNEELNKMIDNYIIEAVECVRLSDDVKSEIYFDRMMAGMEKQPNWTYDRFFAYYSTTGDGTFLKEMPKVIQALRSYKIARQYELDQLLITDHQVSQSVFKIEQHNNQSQSQQQSISISFDQVINWVQDNPSLGSAETEVILAKVREIQAVAESPEPKKTKWEKMKPFLLWLGDKGVDLAIQVIPLILMSVK